MDIILPIMVVMALDMVVAILQSYTFNEKTSLKQTQNHRLTIGTIGTSGTGAAARKAIIHMSKSVSMTGYQLLLIHLSNKEKQKRYKECHCIPFS